MPTKKLRAISAERMPAKNRNGLPAYQRIQGAILISSPAPSLFQLIRKPASERKQHAGHPETR
jgi:hypothetical protein